MIKVGTNTATERAALYCKVSIYAIKKEGKDHPDEGPGTPGKKCCNQELLVTKDANALVSNFDHYVIFNIIHVAYIFFTQYSFM